MRMRLFRRRTWGTKLTTGRSILQPTLLTLCAHACKPIDYAALLNHSHHRLQKFTPYSLDALLLAMVYISRITHRSPPTIATSSETQTPFIPFLPESTPRSSAGRQDGVAHRQHDTDRRNLSDDGSELPPPPLTPWTGHRLLLASLHIASSYISDAFIPL